MPWTESHNKRVISYGMRLINITGKAQARTCQDDPHDTVPKATLLLSEPRAR